MKSHFGRIGLLFALVWLVPAWACAENAPQAFADGQTLLAKGDFDGALRSFAAAARADRGNQEYLQHYSLVRRVVELRQRLETERDPQQWAYVARGLYAFYVGEGLYGEALSLNRTMHAKLNNASSAALLAETALAINNNAEAAETLGSLDAAQATPATQALLGVALARLGKIDEARRVASQVSLPDDVGPRTMYTVARLSAMTGNSAEAVQLLVRCFESVPPSILTAYKTHAQRCPDFAALASTDALAQALEAESKIPESKCSGGSGCAGCPMRGKCPASKGG